MICIPIAFQRDIEFAPAKYPWLVFLTLCSLTSAANRLLANEGDVPPGAKIHLDASQLPATRAAAGLPEWKDGDAMNEWADVSGNAMHFRAANENQRPRWTSVGTSFAVRFDGIDDALESRGWTTDASNLEVWMVVAPRRNPGEYRGILATHAEGKRDYESGLNIDLGPGPSIAWDTINVEGRGFSGAQNLARQKLRFGTLHRLRLCIDRDSALVRLQIDGQAAGQRPWTEKSISIEGWTLGARHFTHGPGPQQTRGFFEGDVVEVLVYDRLLDVDVATALDQHLDRKHSQLAAELSKSTDTPSMGHPLVRLENAPDVQMLLPGFSVRELPVQLTNVNNVRYRSDGTLVALGYNGDVHLIRDRDGDGLEDDAIAFYQNRGSLVGPIGLQWTPESFPQGQGALVACKGKVVLLADRDGDDRADEEVVLAQGWDPLPVNVDAVGLAVGPDGSVYFGLGTSDYANAYQVDASGHSQYDLNGEHGTIQRIGPDGTRETVCTGVRFPIGIAFNPLGDLFCTDQEGATWLPNGNPLDELLHIRTGRHYGFPPRHPRHNPSVIDEPSVFDYGPQHQSTCGLVFNGSVSARFGPARWAQDALVCGESRGKIWRTQLAKTDSGYVAQSQLLACLQMLTVDACTSPAGALVVACHSGPPDWGTGPAGPGRLFQIRDRAPDTPRPVSAWFQSPTEICIALDHPIDPGRWQVTTGSIEIERGRYVRAGDRYENLIPPYAVVQQQLIEPRISVPIHSVGLSPDFRTITLAVPRQSDDVSFAIQLPATAQSDPSGVPQRPEMDVDLEPQGVEVQWTSQESAQPTWTGWLPHLDLQVAKDLTSGSSRHEELWSLLRRPGTLTLHTQLNLTGILRPKVQPGAALDYEWPKERVTLHLRGNGWEVTERVLAGSLVPAQPSVLEGQQATAYALDPNADGELRIDLTCVVRTSYQSDPVLAVDIATQEDTRLRAVPLTRLRLPWAMESGATEDFPLAQAAELEGGNWGRGRRLFLGLEARCGLCHHEPGSGRSSKIGPDLSNLRFRDYASVMRDIEHPSHAINPEFISHQLRLQDGTVLTGVLREVQGQWTVGDSEGRVHPIDRSSVDELLPSAKSAMPEGLLEKLTADQKRDLMTYLLISAPSMPLQSPQGLPALRTSQAIQDVLANSQPLPVPLRKLRMVLVAGPKDHGPNEHDYPAWLVQWGQLLSAAEEVEVEPAWEFPSEAQLSHADVLVFFQKGSWGGERARAMDAYFARGGGAVYLHWAVNGDDQVADFSTRIGLASWGGRIHYRHGPLQLRVDAPEHPILRNVAALDLVDESYWLLTGDLEKIQVLASSHEENAWRPQLWTYEPGRGRVFVSIPGHYSWTFDDPVFRTVLLRGIAWTTREPVDRFNELVPLGARVSR